MTKRTYIVLSVILVVLFAFGSCGKQDPKPTPTDPTSSATESVVSIYDEQMSLIQKWAFSSPTDNTIAVSEFEKTGYKFDGLYDVTNNVMIFNARGFQSPMVMLDTNYSVVARYTPVVYQLVFDAKEGRLASSSDYLKNISYNESVGLFPAPILDGKNFDGWFDESGNRFSAGTEPVYTKFSADGFAISGEIIKLHARYSTKYCTVSLIYSDGSMNRGLQVEYGQMLPDMTEYFKDDGSRMIVGFGVSYSSTVPYSDPVVTDLELYAIWQDYKTIGLVYTEGDIRMAKICRNGNLAELPKPEREGYQFEGWYGSELLSGNRIDSVAFGNLAEFYYAKWSVQTYTIRFVADGRLVASETFSIDGRDYQTPSVPEKAHYTGRWESYRLEYKDITVNAIYDPETVTITLSSDSGYSGKDVLFGEDYTLPILKKKGSTFIGWYFGEEQLTDENGRSVKPYLYEGEVIATAVWESQKCTLSFETNGGDALAPVVVEYGKPHTLTEKPQKEGFLFAGWFDETLTNEYINDVTLTENLLIYAKWVKSYAIYNEDDLKQIYEYPTANYHLMSDINLKGEEWTPIPAFDGLFDGNGYKIYNFTLRKNNVDSAFVLKNTGTIRNITFANVEFANKLESARNSCVAVVCAINEGKLMNVSAEKVNMLVNLVNTNAGHYVYVGVIAGMNKGTVYHCSAQSELIFKSDVHTWWNDDSNYDTKTWIRAGGVLGENLGEVNGIESNLVAKVNAYVGSTNAYSYTYGRNYVTKAVAFCLGGAIGAAEQGNVRGVNAVIDLAFYSNAGISESSAYNHASVVRYSFIGGVFGSVYDKAAASDCYSEGQIAYERVGASAASGEFFIGGIVGKLTSTVSNCASAVNITEKRASGCSTGGVAGRIELNGKVSNVAYYGTIAIAKESNGSGYYGGLAGTINGVVTKGYFHGTIVAQSNNKAADIVGYISASASVSKTIGNGNTKKVFVDNAGAAKDNFIITVDCDEDILFDREMLFLDLCMYEPEFWAIDESTGLYLISFPETKPGGGSSNA